MNTGLFLKCYNQGKGQKVSCIKTAAISLVVLISGLVIERAVAADDSQLLVSNTATISRIASNIEATIDAGEMSQSDIDQLFFLYKDARSAGLWGEADTLAKRIVNTAIRSDGIDSRVTAVALTNLANLQTSKDDNVSAVQNFAAAIDIVERLDDRLSPDLITPLKGMGSAHMQAGHADRARDAWYRAVHISHVNFGPHNSQQIETLYSIARLFYRSGMGKEADRVQRRIYYLRARKAAMLDRNKAPVIGE